METSDWQLRWELCGDGRAMTALRDRESVRLVLQVSPAERARIERVDFVIQGRNARGYLTPWLRVACLGDVPVGSDGRAGVRWSLADLSPARGWERWAFASFRFVVRVHGRNAGKNSWQRRRLSPLLRHHASTVGFYGFGPSGEIFANAELRRVARATGGGIVLRRRASAALRRLAAQVPAGSRLRLFGYSLGGFAAVRFARELQARGVAVARLLLVDPVVLAGRPLVAPANTRRAVSYYQRNGGRWFFLIGRAGRGVPILAEPGAETEIVNTLLTAHPDGEPVMHEDVPRFVAKFLLDELRQDAAENADAALAVAAA